MPATSSARWVASWTISVAMAFGSLPCQRGLTTIVRSAPPWLVPTRLYRAWTLSGSGPNESSVSESRIAWRGAVMLAASSTSRAGPSASLVLIRARYEVSETVEAAAGLAATAGAETAATVFAADDGAGEATGAGGGPAETGTDAGAVAAATG